MSGPSYPPGPGAGSNGIGQFAIGVSPLGTIPKFDVWATVLSQYANSEILTQLLLNFYSYLDQSANIDAFFDLMFNVDTAQGYGLDCCGRIVNVSRTLSVPNGTYLGFEGQGNTVGTFGESPFYNGEVSTGNYQLSDSVYRTLILAKALSNISNGSVPSINQILLLLFPNRGNAYVTDKNPAAGPSFSFNETGAGQPFGQASFGDIGAKPNMTIFYVFNFTLTPGELAIVEQSGVIPKPVGVTASVVQNPP
jgi:hypothetical protein